jgi:hypothetical protein
MTAAGEDINALRLLMQVCEICGGMGLNINLDRVGSWMRYQLSFRRKHHTDFWNYYSPRIKGSLRLRITTGALAFPSSHFRHVTVFLNRSADRDDPAMSDINTAEHPWMAEKEWWCTVSYYVCVW